MGWCFVLTRRRDGVLPTTPFLARWNAGRASVEPLPGIEPADGPKPQYGFMYPSYLDDKWRIFVAHDPSPPYGKPPLIIITTSNGHRVASFPTWPWGYPPFLAAETGRMLAAYAPPEDEANKAAPHTLILYDLQEQERRTLTIDGQIVSMAADLTRAAVVRPHVEDGGVSYSVHLVDLPSGSETTLITHDQTLRVSKQQWSASQNRQLTVDRFHESGIPKHDLSTPHLVFNEEFTQAIWVRRQVREYEIIPTIIRLDLTDGTHQELVGKDKLPALPLHTGRWRYSTINVYGFLPDDRTVVYELNGRIVWLDIATGNDKTLSLMHEGLPCGLSQFSPNRRRALVKCTRPGDRENEYDHKHLVIDPDGTSTIVDWERSRRVVSWIDDDRLFVTTDKTVSIVAADGSSRRQVFPPLNRADWPDVLQP